MIFKQAKVAFIDGVRTTFAKSPGPYGKLRSYELGREALLALRKRNPVLNENCEQVTFFDR